MGNIASLTRDNFGTNNYTGYNGNRLTNISGFTNSTYAYDANGNLTSDSQKNISLGYNFLNLPQTVSGSQNLTYTYNAAGEKLQKQAGGITTNYIDGIQYTNNSIDFIQTEEGLARRSGSSYSYEYNLSDHLGNVGVTFYQNPTTNQLEVLQRDDYYAFGLRKEPVAKAGLNKYLYNGKELQEELGQYDYGARFYDPVIGRFNVVDRFSEKYYSMSTYQYGALDPVKNIDVNGDSIWYSFNKNIITMHMTGKVINGSKDDIDMKETVSDMANGISSSFQGKFKIGDKEYMMKTDVKLEAVSSMDEVNSSDLLIVLADASGKGARGATNEIGGKTIHVASSDYPEKGTISSLFGYSNTRSFVHEVGHAAGLSHFTGFGNDNLMKQKVGGTDLSSGQLKSMFNNRGSINRGSNFSTNPYTGQKSPNSTIFDRNTRAIGSINNVGLRTKWTN